jgi:hypothetical protein
VTDWAQRQRGIKVGKLVALLERAGRGDLAPAEWVVLATLAGCRPPSATTREQVVTVLTARRSRAA